MWSVGFTSDEEGEWRRFSFLTTAKTRNNSIFSARRLQRRRCKRSTRRSRQSSTVGENAAQIAADIVASNAIMVLLGPNVEALKHTRDWVVWESGTARGTNKDIWVLEALDDSPRLSVIIPHLRHYVCFPYTDPWLAYLRSIVASYDDSHILKAVVAGAGLGAGISETATGALIGGGIALLLAANAQTRPAGLPTMCPQCRSFYSVHLSVPAMRCPVCNAAIRFAAQNP